MQEDKELDNKEVEPQSHPEDVFVLLHQLQIHPPGGEPEEQPELYSQDFHNSLIQLFTDLRHHDNMLVPNPPSLADLASILVQSEAQPVRIHYSHTMPEHAPELIGEGKWQPSTETSNQPEGAKPRKRRGVAYERQRAGGEQGREPDIRASREGLAPTYEVVNTLKHAAEKTGIPLDEILTTRDIQDEWNVNRHRIHEWTRRGPHGEPHLSPLPVRLKAAGGGQLLFRREDVESKISNPPKPGRPWK
jgi:hypothetical protein